MNGDQVLVDNDVVFKLCAFGYHGVLVDGAVWAPASMLPFGKFVLRDLARKSRGVCNREGLTAAVEEVISGIEVMRPSGAAIELAADLEEAANAKALELDAGESQLLAMLILGEARLIITGDKRAVAAIEVLEPRRARQRIASLEQLLVMLLELGHFKDLRRGVCAEPQVDTATTACFACHSEQPARADIEAGLKSYIAVLKIIAPTVLCDRAELARL
ncbi:hypothetical protein [Novosphingopyxis sp.]|uniref:hypothetical protein n=1 Tax=Novosphingopyxis sp. TaxID=2709690 RepID=UPI003B5C02BB